ncbi:hypothetical protein ACFLS4_02730 [Bacteroidota bacterium]
MKKICFLILLLYCQITAFSQITSNDIKKGFDNLSNHQPIDQIFIHLNRNLYYPGDTIRFQAYIRDRQTGVLMTHSISLYAMLLNSNHETVDSARFRINNSIASGWLEIPDSVAIGDYSVLAFTSKMMNFNPEFAFTTPIRISERRVKINNESYTDDSQILYAKTLIDLRFLPEGGTFVYDIPQRLAFNTVESAGKTLHIKGEIVNQNGEIITEFCSGRFGPGIVEFTPVQGDKYFAVLKGGNYSEKKWPLPVPEESGVTLKVDYNNKSFLGINVYENGLKNNIYFVSISMNNALILLKEFRLDPLQKLNVNTENLPAGTAFVTLFNQNLDPIAERLVFINNHKKLYISIDSVKSYNSGEESELTVNVTNEDGKKLNSFISIAVIDSTLRYYSDFPIPDIESVFLYDQGFYNNLPTKIKLTGLNNIDKNSIDILLLTYGWRKFKLKDNTQQLSAKNYEDYEYLLIKNRDSKRKERSAFNIMTCEGANTYSLPINHKKEAHLYYDSLNPQVRQIVILPDEDPKKNRNYIDIIFPGNPDFINKAKQQYKFNLSKTENSQYINTNSVYNYAPMKVDLEEITVKAPKPRYKNSHTEFYATANIRAYTGDDIFGITLVDALGSLGLYKLNRTSKIVILRPSRTFNNADIPATFVIDGFSVGESYESIDYLNTLDIESISILKGSQGYTRYGARGGIIFIDTKYHAGTLPNKEELPLRNDFLMKRIGLFRSEIEYYIPTKEEIKSIPYLQNRPTILWLNEIYVNNGKTKIRYPNNLYKGKAIITVNGVSLTNQVGSARFSYTVE